MQNFENLNYLPPVTEYIQFPNPQSNEPFNRATQPNDKPVIAKHIFAIDSRQRDFIKFPNSNEYSIPIPERYRNVTGIELKAAILPRTEYNINSCNKYLDLNLGDFISDILINGSNIVSYFDINNISKPPPNGKYPFDIINNSSTYPAEINANIIDGKIINFDIVKSGNGFNYNNPPQLDLYYTINGSKKKLNIKCIAKIGIDINVEIREGQYIIGGNPELYVRNNGSGTTFGVQNQTTNPVDSPIQSWIPFNLLNEIEAGINFYIQKKLSMSFNYNNASKSYNRKSIFNKTITSTKPPNYKYDYPLLFSTRLVSQYPLLDNSNTENPSSYSTNSCNFNRINISNNLLIQINTNDLSSDYFFTLASKTITLNILTDSGDNDGTDSNAEYDFNIVGAFLINQSSLKSQTWLLSLDLNDIGTPSQRSNFRGFKIDTITGDILNNNTNFKLIIPNFIDDSAKIASFGLKFATGENQTINMSTIFGFNKINYNTLKQGKYKKANNVQPANLSNIKHPQNVHIKSPTLQLSGLTYRTDNDYCLIGDPEYVILSFRAKYGSNSSIPGINDRVESQNSSNLDRIFACLIYDSTVPSVLQEMSSGSNNLPIINSAGAQQNANCTTYLMNSIDNTNINVTSLAGNSGSQNAVYQKTPGNLKAMKGTDFDKKLIEFPQPIAQIFDMSLRFSKFTKFTQGSDEELYDFKGKEHLLIFEITCSDFMTGKRF